MNNKITFDLKIMKINKRNNIRQNRIIQQDVVVLKRFFRIGKYVSGKANKDNQILTM